MNKDGKLQQLRKGANIGQIHYPKTIEDVEKIVSTSGTILGTGLGHTHSRIDENRQKTTFISSKRIKHIYRANPTLLDTTSKLKRRLSKLIDPDLCPRENHDFKDYFINVGSGVTLAELSEYLKDKNLALPVTSQDEKETIGGISQTGTHGSGWHLGAISDYIVSLRVVLPEGKIATVEPKRKISKDKDDNVINNTEFFNSICCGIGALGFVYDVIILVQDAVEYKYSVGATKWLHFRGDIDEFIEDVRNLDLFIDPSTSEVTVVQSGPFLKPFDYPAITSKKKSKLDKKGGIQLSTESAIPIYQMDDVRTVLNVSLFYIMQTGIKCHPLHIRFGKRSEHYLSSTYSDDKNILGFVYIKMSMDLDKNADRNLRDLTNFEVFLSTHRGQVNMEYIQGGVMNRPGIKKWSKIFKLFENNPFSSDFAEEVVFESV